MKKIFNGTPHSINIINPTSCVFNPSIRKWTSENPEILKSIHSDGILNAKLESIQISTIIEDIPTFDKKIVDCDDIPDAEFIIVSALFFSAARVCGKDTSRLFTVADPVYSPDGRTIIGSLGICRGF